MSDFQHAQLDWDENGQPLSRAFGDVYFSRHSGLNETRHVFLATNRLAERFAALGDGEVLCIGETGFGTGLNFLCAWQLFERVAPAGARLEFVSVEKFPLAAADLRRALALWPELAPWSEALLGQYLAVHPGFQRLAFAGGRVGLTLLLGDALECLPQLDARVDAWFLDGFAPAKNPDMWSPVLFAELARLSAPQATLGTFTSAGFVRRGLIEAGFAMQRVPGYGQKREMLSGTYQGPPANAGKPWYARPAPHAGRRAALVVGGGLAGCASAASLAARGWQVTLIERHPGLAREASGNPQGVLYLKLSAHGTPLSRLVLSGFGHTRRLLERLRRGHDWDACGVLQLAFDAKEAQRQAQLAAAFPADLLHGLDREQAERLAGVALPAGGLFYPEAGWVHPPALCQALAATPGITLLSGRAVRLRREGD
ncbi:TPA: bifunctional tRNA (5-methylaminomethyl-2-thiouridine)(34)-methyltransferase MnmD/FAD-dependent 5-carboxymethylaminomethyl-2-thiouridine(34) oxidoreductase MnmC, partial [Pseudomonas aeruginosa]|nr:bifunctional tRNA (5-methylaminomethyl-2-thiouridine)(34)-methyltransferase MnmD/FAD-dependent 5-carboxymethylaminomethyl-2-thiouridine(34) oxidoreductase MnmC [Pseudomonas aeruginosa]